MNLNDIINAAKEPLVNLLSGFLGANTAKLLGNNLNGILSFFGLVPKVATEEERNLLAKKQAVEDAELEARLREAQAKINPEPTPSPAPPESNTAAESPSPIVAAAPPTAPTQAAPKEAPTPPATAEEKRIAMAQNTADATGDTPTSSPTPTPKPTADIPFTA